jgi:hypothetical protein
MTTIVTSCSKRKRAQPLAVLRADTLPGGSLEMVAREWKTRVEAADPVFEAGSLYSGRQFHEVLRAVDATNADLLIISAGLGVLRGSDQVPSYSLTIAPGSSENVLAIVQETVAACDWWRTLTAGSQQFCGLRVALAQAEGLILIALPSAYLQMVEEELEQLSERRLARIRVFTSPSFRFRDERLNNLVMPYDARLDGPDSPCLGTVTDFTGRALRDFSTEILPRLQRASVKQHSAAVSRRLEGWASAVRPARRRQSDAELLAIIRANWGDAGQSPSRMLRRVRSDLGLACEQARMRDLYKAVFEEMSEGAS